MTYKTKSGIVYSKTIKRWEDVHRAAWLNLLILGLSLTVTCWLFSANYSMIWWLAVDFALLARIFAIQRNYRTRRTDLLFRVWECVSLLYALYCVLEIWLLPYQTDTCVDLAGALLFSLVIFNHRRSSQSKPHHSKVLGSNFGCIFDFIFSFCGLIFSGCFALTALMGFIFLALVQRKIVDQVHYYCEGNINDGTIIFIHPGMGAPAAVYSHLPPILSQSTRTCSIQTPGIGWSSESDSTAAEDTRRLGSVVRREFLLSGIPIEKRIAFFAGHSRGMMMTYYYTNFRNNADVLHFNQTFVVGIDGFPKEKWESRVGPSMFKDRMANYAVVVSLVRGFALTFLPGFFRNRNPFDAGGDLGWWECMMVLDGFLRPNFMRTGVRQGKELADPVNFPQDGPPRIEVFADEKWINELRQDLENGKQFNASVNPDARVQWNIITSKIDDAGGVNVTHTGIVTYERNAILVADWLLILLRSFRDMGYYYYPTYH